GLNGNFDGANVQLTLDKPERITFYYNDITHKIQDSHSYKMLKDAELPVLGGDFAALEGDKVMRDLLMDKFYQTTLDVKAGTYTAEIKQKGQKSVKQKVTIRQDGKASFYYDLPAKKSSWTMAVSIPTR
ncbi:MAG: amylopullulanase, partial [Anaerovibrio sp.]|nr:amylopullulanase [Anaerovibrio sp.]